MPVQIGSRALQAPQRVSRSEKRREELKEEILRFAARVRPSIREKRCAAFHSELSTIMRRMTVPEIKRFRKSIQRGEQDSSFPASVIVGRDGEAAGHIADFLGERYVGFMLGLARSGGDVHDVNLGKRYLEWASEHGGKNVKAKALAGVAKAAADEIIQGNGDFIEREMIKKRGIMRVLSRHVGEGEAWGIVKEQAREEKAKKKTLSLVAFMAGACVAAATTIMQSISGLRDVGTLQLAVMGISAITAVVAGVGSLAAINMGMLQRRIGKLLKAEEHV